MKPRKRKAPYLGDGRGLDTAENNKDESKTSTLNNTTSHAPAVKPISRYARKQVTAFGHELLRALRGDGHG